MTGVQTCALPISRDLRQAFVATMTDAGFREEAERLRLTINYVDGEHLAEIIKSVYQLPPDAIAVARQSMGNEAAAD